jgi:hypothetical protein
LLQRRNHCHRLNGNEEAKVEGGEIPSDEQMSSGPDTGKKLPFFALDFCPVTVA